MSLLFENCQVFDGRNVLEGRFRVGVRSGRIDAVSAGPLARDYDEIIDLDGRTLMPGLIDAHVHVYAFEANLSKNDETSIVERTLHASEVMRTALNRGFTSLRDAGGADHNLARALQKGMIKGPRLFYSGLALSQTGGHGDYRQPHRGYCACGYCGAISTIADGETAVRQAAREQLRLGATQIKIMASGGAASPSDPIWMVQYSESEIAAAVEEAARRRTYVMAHAYTAEAIARCVRLGVRTIEHGNMIDAETAVLCAAHGAYVVPTLATYDALAAYGAAHGWDDGPLAKIREVQAHGLASLKICHDAGVKMGFGTDLLGLMHVHQCDEFSIRAKVLPSLEILRSATSVNGEILQMADRLGVVKEDAVADLIVIDGDPLEDVSIFTADGRSVPVVVLDGEVVKNTLPGRADRPSTVHGV